MAGLLKPEDTLDKAKPVDWRQTAKRQINKFAGEIKPSNLTPKFHQALQAILEKMAWCLENCYELHSE